MYQYIVWLIDWVLIPPMPVSGSLSASGFACLKFASFQWTLTRMVWFNKEWLTRLNCLVTEIPSHWLVRTLVFTIYSVSSLSSLCLGRCGWSTFSICSTCWMEYFLQWINQTHSWLYCLLWIWQEIPCHWLHIWKFTYFCMDITLLILTDPLVRRLRTMCSYSH